MLSNRVGVLTFAEVQKEFDEKKNSLYDHVLAHLMAQHILVRHRWYMN